MKVLLFPITLFLSFLLIACAEKKLTEEEAGSLIAERISKMPGRSVSFYLGAMTDPSYIPVYRKIATGKYLEIKDGVYVEAAKKKMTVIEATPEGKEMFECEKNRCTVEVCKYSLDGILVLTQKGKFGTARYRLKSECGGEIYDIFKPLADKLFIKSEVAEEKIDFELDKDGWKIK
jgi:hypothetical protein